MLYLNLLLLLSYCKSFNFLIISCRCSSLLSPTPNTVSSCTVDGKQKQCLAQARVGPLFFVPKPNPHMMLNYECATS